jgi:arylsulfate sulfotransferase
LSSKGGKLKRVGLQILQWSVAFTFFVGFISGCNGGTTIDPATPLLTPSSAVLMPGQTLQFSATMNGTPLTTPVWFVNGVPGGAAPIGTISSTGLYTAPPGSAVSAVLVTASNVVQNAHSAPTVVSFFQPNHFQPGTVSGSNNPLVAVYTFTAPQGSTAQVQFGTTTSYGLTTWSQPAPQAGGNISILVAGMRASSTYHLQALVHLPDGTTISDTDKQFTTAAIPAALLPNLTAQQTPGLTPAAGVELFCLFEESSQTQLTAVITDLAGNVIWYYPIQPSGPFPMKLLPNGHMLVVVSGNAVQEIDLAGNIVSQVSESDMQQGLKAIGFPLSAQSAFNANHDVLKLPNGHLIILVSVNQTFTDQPGISTVTGNALIDWDPQQGPVWTWSTFDHIPLTHAPYGTSDLTHANAVLYSPDDGNLILSMRNQNWIVKINYGNGAGDGRILWRLGPDGDFTLPNGQAPVEWNYGQHYPVFLGPNTSGIFSMMFFNNGNNRLVDVNNDVCETIGLTACYSSVPIFQLNEYTNTAQVLEETNLSPAYSICCGNADFLSNGDLEYDVANDLNTPGVSHIQEVTPEQHPQLVWQMNVTGQLAYRGFRIPSLYPGVEWTQSAIAAANVNAAVLSAPKAGAH